MNLIEVAWRNVWRNRRRTLVTVSAMSLALVVMILYAGLMEGYLERMESQVLDVEVGDLQIFAAGYRRKPSLYTRIEEPARLLGPLVAAGFPSTGRLLGWGLAAVDESSAGVSLRGVEVEQDARVSRVHEEVAEGQWLDPADRNGVVLGRRLARTLGVSLGEEIFVLSQGADGGMAYDLFPVRGVLRSVGEVTDRSGVFMNAAAFREMMVVPDGVHQIIVRRPPEVELAAAKLHVREVAPQLDVQTWQQLLPTVSSMLDSARAVIGVMFFIVYLAVAILILNAMLMAVFERIRELGVLKALGVGPGEVLALILLESAIQTGIAIAAGLVIGTPAALYLEHFGIDMGILAGTSMMGIAFDSVWKASLKPAVFAGPILSLVVIVALAVLYPALKAAMIQPVQAIRHQ